MKKYIFALGLALSVGFTFSACSDDDDKGGNGGGDPKSLLEYPYSTLTEADQKKKLSQEGESTIKLMQALPDEASVKLLDSFSAIGDELFYVLGETESPSQSALRSTTVLSEYAGKYEWNAKTQAWDKSTDKVTDKLIAIFPAKRGGTANDGKIEVTKVDSKQTIDDVVIPSNVSAKLFVSDKQVGELTADAAGINESTLVETAKVNIALGAYRFVTDINKKGSQNVVQSIFVKGSDAILSIAADLQAAITVEMLEKEDVSSIKDGNFTIAIVKDLVIAGYVDGKSLAPEIKKISDEKDALDNQYPWTSDLEKKLLELKKKEVEAINKYSNLALVSTTEKYKVAKVTFDLDIEEYPMSNYTQYDTEIKLVLNFNDKTKVDADVFFGTGFNKVVTMWEDLIAKFN